MEKLDIKNATHFGKDVRDIVARFPDYLDKDIGYVIEDYYLIWKKEAERDARQWRNK